MTYRSSHEKGLALEHDFAKHLRATGWRKIVHRGHVPGSINGRGAEVDLIAERGTEAAEVYTKVAKPIFGVAAFVFGVGLYLSSGMTIALSVLLAGIGAVLVGLSRVAAREHVWVECKNREARVDIDQIAKVRRQIKDYAATGDTRYSFAEVHFVSSTGFVKSALSFAAQNGVVCFVRTPRGFEKVGYAE